MRRTILLIVILCSLALPQLFAGEGRIIKVLPHFLDSKGRHSLSPSLYDRDAYQAILRNNPAKRSGVRYDVQWKVKVQNADNLKLRLELRGVAEGNSPKQTTLEKALHKKGAFSKWTAISFAGEDFKKFGEVTAWRMTLWNGDEQLAEQKSFLW